MCKGCGCRLMRVSIYTECDTYFGIYDDISVKEFCVTHYYYYYYCYYCTLYEGAYTAPTMYVSYIADMEVANVTQNEMCQYYYEYGVCYCYDCKKKIFLLQIILMD